MKRWIRWTCWLWAFGCAAPAGAAGGELLELVKTIALPGVSGRIDHMTLDAAAGRLYIAALGNNTLEVVDLAQGKHLRSLAGFGEPQGVVHVAAANRLFVANGSADRVDILDGASLAPLAHISGMADADNVRLDAREGLVYVGYGSGALRVLDARSGEARGEIALAGHPESFQLEQSGTRIFVNVPTAKHVAVIDRATRKVAATWGLQGAGSNFPMALDEGAHRLYVGTRSPAALLVYNTQSGALTERITIGGDVDDVFFDPATKRLYAVCGEGVVSVIAQTDADHHTVLGTVKTASRARTGLFDPASHQLFVAVPAGLLGTAELRVYRAH